MADGSSYAGEFVNGMNSGHGILTFSDRVRRVVLVLLLLPSPSFCPLPC
jgi:hypothetical protein